MDVQRLHKLRVHTDVEKSFPKTRQKSHRISTLASERPRHEQQTPNKNSLHLPRLQKNTRGSTRSFNRKRPFLSRKMLMDQLKVKDQLGDIVGFTRLLIKYKELWSLACAWKCVLFIGEQLYNLAPGLLITIGKLCISNAQYKEAITIFKYALEYTWFTDQTQSELQVYDCIGVSHYYLGDMKTARLYHQRYQSGRYEPKASSIRRRAVFKLSKRSKPNQLGAFSKFFYDDINLENKDVKLKDILNLIVNGESLFVTRYLLCNEEDVHQQNRQHQHLFFTHLSSNRILRKNPLAKVEQRLQTIQ